MRKVSIFVLLRDPNNHAKVLGKEVLRVINVRPDFEGFGEKGAINMERFKDLADSLEPGNDGFDIL